MNRNLRVGFLFSAALAASMASAQRIHVLVNGDPVRFEGQRPIMSGDRVLVPLRGVLEKMGAHVEWDRDTQTVRAHREGSEVKLTIGENTASVDHRSVDLDVPAQVINGSTMVPLRFVGEALGERVHWDAQSYTVEVAKSDSDFTFHDRAGRRDGRAQRYRDAHPDQRDRRDRADGGGN